MYENNKNIGWKKKNNGSNGSYDDTLIKNQINILDDKIDEEVNNIDSQLAHKANSSQITHYMVNLEQFNISKDGINPIQTTEGINNALIFAKEKGYSTVILPQGTYMISKDSYIKITGGLTFDLNRSVLIKEPNNLADYSIINIEGDYNTVKNGIICGDRENHDFSDGGTHEWGIGIVASSNSNFTNIENCKIYNTTGYGICTKVGWNLINSFTGYLSQGQFSKSTGLLESSTEYTYFDYKLDIENSKIVNKMFSLTGNGYANTGITEPLGYYMTFYDKDDNYIGYSTMYRFYDDVDIESFKYLYPNLKFIRFSIFNSDTETIANVFIRSTIAASFLTVNNCEISKCRTLGIAITGGKYINIKNCKIHDIGGASPGFGVDIEDGYKSNQYIKFENCSFYNNKWGNLVVKGAREVIIDNCKFQGYKQNNSNNFSSGVTFSSHSTTYVNYVIKNSNFIQDSVSGRDCIIYDSNFIMCNKLEGEFKNCNFTKSNFANYNGIKLNKCKVYNSSFLLRFGDLEIEDSYLENCTMGKDTAGSGMPIEKYSIKESTLKNTSITIKECKNIDISRNKIIKYGVGTTGAEAYIGITTKEKSLININDNIINIDRRGAFISIDDVYESCIRIRNNTLDSIRSASNIQDKIKINTYGECDISNNNIFITQLDNAYYCIYISNAKKLLLCNNSILGTLNKSIKTENVAFNVINNNILKGECTHDTDIIGDNIEYI